MENIYLPRLAEITSIRDETPDIRTFELRLESTDSEGAGAFDYAPGQFVELSVVSEGEAPFCLSNSPTRGASLECSIKKVGVVTEVLHESDVGDTVGIRGPYGNGFPVDDLRRKNLLFVAGGIGLAPLRSLINYCLDNRSDFGSIDIVNGARTSRDLVYKDEYEDWESAEDTRLHLTVDCDEENWTCMVGVVPKVLEELGPSCDNSVAVVCGPPIMIRYTIPVLLKLGFCKESMITTLEMKMKCGLGKCGRCNIGNRYICKDGPVFSYAELEQLGYEL